MVSSAASTLALGAVIAGRYRVVRAMAAGGFGSVFECVRLDDGTPLALKVLHTKLGADAPAVERFRREAAMLRGLAHPSIVRVLDFGELEGGLPFLALELLRGWSLRQELKRRGALPPADVGAIALELLEALVVAHASGLVHRDIKPANVFLCGGTLGRGTVKLLDFGIAKAVHGDYSAHSKLTETGQMIGTPQYMAPEQVRGDPVSAATDLYALGLLMAEMLTGTPVVRGSSDIDVLLAHVMPEPHRLEPAVLGTPLGPVVERAVRKPVEARYGSAAQMLDELRPALRAGGTASEARTAPTVSPSPAAMPWSGAASSAPWPGAAPTAPWPGAAPTAPRPRSGMKLGLGIGLLGLGIGLGLGVALLVLASSGKQHTHSSDSARASAQAGSSQAADIPAAPGELVEALEVPDLAHVDPQAIVVQARRIALRLEPTAVLGCSFAIHVSSHLEGGTVDLRPPASDRSVSLTFIYRPVGRRPGEDEQGQIRVEASAGHLRAVRQSGLLASCGLGGGQYPEPRCAVARAWAVVVAAGVPANAVASVTLDRNGVNDTGVTFWHFLVENHDEYRSDVDAQTCKLVHAPAAGAGGGAAKPTGIKHHTGDGKFE